MANPISNIKAVLNGSTDRHYIAYYTALLFGIAAVIMGIVTRTGHNVMFGVFIIIFGRVYLTADVEPSDPYADPSRQQHNL